MSAATGLKPGSQCAWILDLLADGEPHTMAEILQTVPCIVHSRVAELRKHGYRVECEHLPGETGATAYLYRLASPAADDEGSAPEAPYPSTPEPASGTEQLALAGVA